MSRRPRRQSLSLCRKGRRSTTAEMVMVSFVPMPDVSTLPLVSSTDTLNDAINVPAVVTVVGGAVVKATLAAAPGNTVTALLVAVVRVLVASVATSEQVTPVFIVAKVNVATPATAVAVVVPERAQVDDSVTTSIEPVPEVITMPLLSSIETAKEGRIAPAVTVADGSVVKPNLLGVFVATATLTVAFVTPPVLVSVATS